MNSSSADLYYDCNVIVKSAMQNALDCKGVTNFKIIPGKLKNNKMPNRNTSNQISLP